MIPTFESANPTTRMYCGDCRYILPQFTEVPDLIFADPVYNIGHPYHGFDDCVTPAEYEKFTRQWIAACATVLSPKGSLWILVPDEIVSFVDQFAVRELGLTRRNWCLWHYRFGQANRAKFIRSKTHLLYYVLDSENFIWNPEGILVASDRSSKYNDPRTLESETPGMRVPLDVWEFCRIQGNNAERCKNHPNQVPEKLLERIIRSCSNSDSCILDPFSGSGTTITVARTLGRSSIGIELVPEYAKDGFERAMRGAIRVQK